MGSYDETHTDDDCDKCDERVGKNKLLPVPFLYLDKNDHYHKDLGHSYRQYFVCSVCFDSMNYRREIGRK